MSTETTDIFEAEDIKNNMIYVIVGLFFPILFFLPMVINKESAYAKFICNQLLILLLVGFASGIINVIPILGQIISVVLGIFAFVCWIILLISAIQGKVKRLPIVGNIAIIK